MATHTISYTCIYQITTTVLKDLTSGSDKSIARSLPKQMAGNQYFKSVAPWAPMSLRFQEPDDRISLTDSVYVYNLSTQFQYTVAIYSNINQH